MNLLTSSKSYIFTLLLVTSLFFSCGKIEQKEIKQPTSVSYSALNDFLAVEKEGFVPFYKDMDRGVLGIDAAEFKDQFALSEVIFEGESGTYDLTFTSMTEIDGESTYRVLIDDKFIAEFQNPETENDFELIPHSAKGIEIKKGQTVRIEFNTHSNDKIPEDGGFAYARGRWKGIDFTPSND